MKKLIIFAVICLTADAAFADDPGMRDTVMVGTVYADLGQPYVDVPIFAVTDDSVMFYAMPVTWSSGSEGIEPSDVFYYYMLQYWETFDSVLVDEHFMMMVGWVDDIDYLLNTYGYRLRCWAIRFTIDSLAPPQVVTVDTTYDPINGSILFGLVGGVESLVPVFVPGAIYYGIPLEVNDDRQILPSNIAYLQNYPNPFNASTTIEFTLPKEAKIELSIYNIVGQKVAVIYEGVKPAGIHTATWDAGKYSSGIYFVRLETMSYSKNIKMLLLK